jgi:hypothetical protein
MGVLQKDVRLLSFDLRILAGKLSENKILCEIYNHLEDNAEFIVISKLS